MDTATKPVLSDPMIDDYLASRGYPMSARNRTLVKEKCKSCLDRAERGALFRCLDRILGVRRG